jgi:surface antigen
MTALISTRFTRGFSRFLRNSALIALAAGFAAALPSAAHAQSHGGGHGGGGYHGGGGGYHGGGYHGGYYGHGWGWGGWGWGGFYPGYYGYSAFDPFWFGYGESYDAEDAYGYPPVGYPPVAYTPPPQAYPPPQGYPQSGYPQQGYAPQYGQPMQNSGIPTDNSRGFYTWQLGVQGGSCNRPYLSQIAAAVTGVSPTSLHSGSRLGGIAVERVIDGKLSRSLDTLDQACATESLELASAGTPVSWNTASGVPVTIQTTRLYNKPDGQNCREYVATAQFASVKETELGAACRNPNGSWQATRRG